MSYNVTVETSLLVEGMHDTITVKNECTYQYTPEKQIISYFEQTEDGNIPTHITVLDGCVDIEREHPAMPDMHICVGETSESNIETPYGSIAIICTPKRVYSRMDQNGGMVELMYAMNIGGADSQNRVCIKVSEA